MLFGLIAGLLFFAAGGGLVDFNGWQVYLLSAVASSLWGANLQFAVNKVQLYFGIGHEEFAEYKWAAIGGALFSPLPALLHNAGAGFWLNTGAAALVLVINYIIWKKVK